MQGIINCYKPIGMTSFDVVAKIRKAAHEKKVGHTGTLDPAASGVLPVCIGKSTKLIDFIMKGDKIYRVEMTLGLVTDTYDSEGEVLYSKDVNISDEDIKETMNSFVGEIMQVPPMYSALKHNGKKLYELARAGIEIDRPARSINIYDIENIDIEKNKVKFEVHCSKGTYIRSLCFDIGNKLGCGAMMSGLERTATGNFSIESSVNVLDINEHNINQYVISPENVLKELPAIHVNRKFEKLLVNGVDVKDYALINVIGNSTYRIYNEDNVLLGIGKKNKDAFKISTLLI